MLVSLGHYFADTYGVGGLGEARGAGHEEEGLVDGAHAGDAPTPINGGDGVIPANAVNIYPDNNIYTRSGDGGGVGAADGLADPPLISRYDSRSVRMMSSSRDRSVQSAVGVLGGLYDTLTKAKGCGGGGSVVGVDETSSSTSSSSSSASSSASSLSSCDSPSDFLFPLIHFDQGDARLYPTDVSQAFIAFQQGHNSSMHPFMGSLALEIFSPDELRTMAKELSLTAGYCDDRRQPREKKSVADFTVRTVAVEDTAAPFAAFDPYTCGLDLQDYTKYLQSTRGAAWLAANAPTVLANLPRLDAMLNNFTYHYLYGYDANIANGQVKGASASEKGGSLGWPLAASLLRDMKAPQPLQKQQQLASFRQRGAKGQQMLCSEKSSEAKGSRRQQQQQRRLLTPAQAQDEGVPRLVGYASHDMTLVELTMALGNFTRASFDAAFGVALFFEVWVTDGLNGGDVGSASEGKEEDVGTRHVRAFYGYPADVDASSNFSYRFWPYSLICAKPKVNSSDIDVHASSSSLFSSLWAPSPPITEAPSRSSSSVLLDAFDVYEAPNGCPLADLERFVAAASAPQSPAGTCYISDETRRRLICGPTDRMGGSAAAGANGGRAGGQPRGKTEAGADEEDKEAMRAACVAYRVACPQWACAASEADYTIIAQGTAPSPSASMPASSTSPLSHYPFTLDRTTGECVRLVAPSDAAALAGYSSDADRLALVAHVMVGSVVAALFAVSAAVAAMVWIRSTTTPNVSTQG